MVNAKALPLLAALLKTRLAAQVKEELAQVMNLQTVAKGEVIIHRESEDGESAYIVHSGELIVERDGASFKKPGDAGSGGGGAPQRDSRVDESRIQLTRGALFGELALLYGCARSATVRATCDAQVWVLSRRAYHRVLTIGARKQRQQLLAQCAQATARGQRLCCP